MKTTFWTIALIAASFSLTNAVHIQNGESTSDDFSCLAEINLDSFADAVGDGNEGAVTAPVDQGGADDEKLKKTLNASN